MDSITLLRSLQSDFIKRLASGCLLHCETEGQYSELTVISGERLKALRDFCWQMAEKYKRTSAVRDVFVSNLKGKLGEEVVKERLADFITEVDYEKRFGGDGNVDFTLTSDPTIGVEVKSRHGSIDKIRWTVSSDEVEKNAVVVCILIQEEVNEAQTEYHLFLAGFLPTQMIKLRTGKISFGIEQLLYGGGLRCYLEDILFSQNNNVHTPKSKHKLTYKLEDNNHLNKPSLSFDEDEDLPYCDDYLIQLYVKVGDECFEQGEYDTAITNYKEALKINALDAQAYYKIGLARYHLKDYEGAIADCIHAIKINSNYAKAYKQIGLARYHLGDAEGAIEDYTQAIRINPNDSVAYRNRAYVRSYLGDKQGAIEDYAEAIKINPHDDYNSQNRGQSLSFLGDRQGLSEEIKMNPNDNNVAYKNGNVRFDLGDFEGAIEDYTQAIKINPDYADAYYNRGNARYNLGDKQGAIEDFQKATDLYHKEGKLAEHKNVREIILDLEIEESLDILNF